MARDPDTIQREIEKARDALAASLDVLTERVDPRRLADTGKQSVVAQMGDPRLKYGLIAVGALIGLIVLRKIFR